MARPTHRVTISRKDGEEITFTDYKGNTVTKKYCPIGALFPSKIDGGFTLALEKKVTLDPETVWVNVYPQKEREESTSDAPEAKSGARSRVRTKTAPADPLFDGDGLPD